jgi:hypothetical protein
MRELALGSIIEEIGGTRGRKKLCALLEPETDAATIRDWLRSEKLLQLTIPADAPDAVLRFPWEYVLSAAFRPDGAQHSHALIVRVLSGVQRASAAPDWTRTVYVELAPGAIGQLGWTFVGERSQARWLGEDEFDDHFASRREKRNSELANLARIADRAASRSPWLVHVAGFDGSQARDLLPDTQSSAIAAAVREPGPKDEPTGVGLVPTWTGRELAWRPCRELAEAVCAAAAKPALVVANLYESQACVAAEAVKLGADAGVGFQDHIDDEVAERFTRELYLGITAPESTDLDHGDLDAREWLLAGAFHRAARRAQLMSPTFHGTGMVLYLRSEKDQATEGVRRVDWCLGPDVRQVVPRNERPLAGNTTSVRLHSVVSPELNFAMLCNGATLFDAFYLKRQSDRRACSALVEVAVHVGGKPQRYEELVHLNETTTDLTPRIRVPVGWLHERMPSEPIRTLIDVSVTPDGSPTHFDPIKRPESVMILPIDSWKDDDVSRQWLPAFVLPRDPAVGAVLRAAQPHLDVLRGDAASGFDGYQSIDPKAPDPYAGVDAQAQAIWNGIVVGMDVRYINPPPAYQETIQRVRTPSRVLHESRGTCIDLALLLASALEYVGIWPALFLLEGHCFVGYWRSEEGLDEFLEKVRIGGDELRPQRDDAHPSPSAGWLLDKSWYGVVRHEVTQTRQLVPLEATFLTNRKGFDQAVRAGKENLRSQRDFHSMMDVWAARDHGVTPLPLLEGTTLDNMGRSL